jgi:hypothetical protein
VPILIDIPDIRQAMRSFAMDKICRETVMMPAIIVTAALLGAAPRSDTT